MFPPEGFHAKGTLAFDCNLIDDLYNIAEDHIQTLIKRFKEHCFEHPWKKHNFELAGFDSESFETFFREKIKLCINNTDKCACIIEGSTTRYFVYGGDVEGIVLNTNESAPRLYWFGFQQQRLTPEWFVQLKTMTDHPEYDQIFEAAVSQSEEFELAKEGKYISPRRTRIVKQKARREIEQLRRGDLNGYTNLVNEMLDTKVIWSKYDLRFGTGWLIHNYTYAYKDLKGLSLALAEADVGFFLEVYRILNP